MVSVSIIVPCYNAEKYIAELLDSVFAQTMQDFELICVDNNSTDGTRDILESYSLEHHNMTVISEPQQGAGCARNAGIALATGQWLYLPDADDVMYPDLLEKATACGGNHNADVVVFRADALNNQTYEITTLGYSLATRWLPEGLKAFNPAEFPEELFNSFQNWTWNKLFRTDFVRRRSIVFPAIMRTEDLLFTGRALSEANTIAVLPESLYLYRMDNPNSTLQMSYLNPLDFYDAFLMLRKALEEHGTWGLYHDSFVNLALGSIIYNAGLSNSAEVFEEIMTVMQKEGLEALDIADFPRELALNPQRWDTCRIIRDRPLSEIAFRFYEIERKTAKDLQCDLSRMRLRNRDAQTKLSQTQQELRDRSNEVENLALKELEATTTIHKLERKVDKTAARLAESNRKLRKERKKTEAIQDKIDDLHDSKTWKIGRTVTFVPRQVASFAKRVRRPPKKRT